jgi:hypothetical protein
MEVALMGKGDESGVREQLAGGLMADEISDACHVVIDAASAILANIEFLQNPGMGTASDRQSMASDAREGVMRLVRTVRDLREAARRPVTGRAA